MRDILITFVLATFGVACGGDSGGSGGSGGSGAQGGRCAEDAATEICQGATNCAFDPATIDCNIACGNLEKVCGSNCPSQPGCTDFTVDNCLTGCNFAKNQACPNVTFGCEAQEDTCAGLGTCIDANR